MENAPAPELLELVDSHAHVDMPEFDADRDDMLARARAAGVKAILAIGGGPGAFDSALPFAERHNWIYTAAGIHPHEAQLATPEHYEALSRLARHPKFLAWGEIGLDYHYDHSPRDVQQRVFVEQLQLARAARRPIILHCREAWPDCLALPRSALAQFGTRRHLPLFYRHAGRRAPRNRDGISGIVCRQRDISQSAEPA